MAKFVNVAGVQFATSTHGGAANAGEIICREMEAKLNSLKGYGLDLVVTCELAILAQTLETAEEVANPGPLLQTYARFAAAEQCHVAGASRVREGENVYNSIVYFGPDGSILGVYHKVNLTMGAIEKGERSGTEAVVIDTAIGRLGGVICFDLNFEELRQQYRALKPDILTFASAYHGGLMQQMWAYDCRAFFVSALQFNGCGVLDPFGRELKVTDCYTNVARATINLDRVMVHLDKNRAKFPEIEKKYLGEVIIDTPPNIGPALIYSTTDKRTAMDVVAEFELQLLDDYLAESLAANAANR